MLFQPISGNFWCTVVTLVIFSSNLSNFEKNPKNQKKFQKSKNVRKSQKIPKNQKKFKNLKEIHKNPKNPKNDKNCQKSENLKKK